MAFDKTEEFFAEKCETHLGVPEVSETDAAIAKELELSELPRVLQGDKVINSGQLSNLKREVAREKVMGMAKAAGIGGYWKR